ncbi:MAG: hypothetical protein HYX71_08010 [Opitutae bacterium]|nr:hypothetical protein [Opitutae bacterium]
MKPPPTHAHINRLIALTLLLLVFSGSLGLGAVWVRQKISATANRSRVLVARLDEVDRRLDEVSAEVAAAVNPDALLRQNQVMRLALATPREVQVVRIAESPELRLAAKRNREIFSLASDQTADRAPVFRVVTASLR